MSQGSRDRLTLIKVIRLSLFNYVFITAILINHLAGIRQWGAAANSVYCLAKKSNKQEMQ